MSKLRIVPKSIKDIIYEELKKEIISGKIKPGERLIEQELSSKYNVSRTPLREAIQKLETEQLVIKVNSGGVMATCLSEKEVRELYELRRCVEGMIVQKVVENADNRQISELESIIDEIRKLKELYENGDDDLGERIVELGGIFHQKLHKIYGNSVCIKVLNELQTKIDRYSYIAAKNNRSTCIRASREHISIFIFIKEGKVLEAVREMKVHLIRAEEITLKQLRNYQELCCD